MSERAMTIEEAARSLVNRSRQGDQNATALIMETKKAADAGGEKAIQALAALTAYANAHPVNEDGMPGIKMPALTETVMLANGQPLTDDLIYSMSQALNTPRQQKIFMYGVQYFRDPIELAKTALDLSTSAEEARALMLGRNVGMARNIQSVRQPGMPIYEFSPAIAWELGEI